MSICSRTWTMMQVGPCFLTWSLSCRAMRPHELSSLHPVLTLMFLNLRSLLLQRRLVLARRCEANAHWLGKCPFLYPFHSFTIPPSPSPFPTVNFKSFHPWGLETKYLALLSQPAHLPVWLLSSLFGWSSSWLLANGQMSTNA